MAIASPPYVQGRNAPPIVAPPPTPEPSPAHRGRRRLKRLIAPAVAFVVFIGVWQLISSSLSSGRQFLLPPPWEVLTKGLLAHDAYSQILPAFARTTTLALVGLVIAMILGIAVGTVLYRFRWFERATYPYLVAIQAIPVLAIAPLIGVAFGYNFSSKLIIVVMIAFFPIPTSFLMGLKSVDRGMVDLFTLHRAGWMTRYWKLAFPNALPSLFTGFRISAGLAVIGAIVGEQSFQVGKPGLGMLFIQFLDYVDYDQVYGCIIVASLLGIAIYNTFTYLSRRLFGSWHESAQHDAG